MSRNGEYWKCELKSVFDAFGGQKMKNMIQAMKLEHLDTFGYILNIILLLIFVSNSLECIRFLISLINFSYFNIMILFTIFQKSVVY